MKLSRRFIQFLVLITFWVSGNRLLAQTYPVQVAVTAVPPYQNYFSSYANEDRLKVTMTFTDFASPPIQVHLKLLFDSPTFDFESNPISQPVFTLYPGIPYTLSTEELQIYFQNQLPVNGPQNSLTEGSSSFCAEVRAVSNNELLNNISCGYFYMQYGTPATLQSPACGSTIIYSQEDANFPDPIQFNFFPPVAPVLLEQDVVNELHIYNYSEGLTEQNLLQPTGLIAVPGSPFAIEGGLSPFILQPIYNQLVKGNQYVWYIHSSLPGVVNQFQNNGWSAPCIFTYDAADSYTDGLIDGLTLEWLDAEGNDPNPGFYPGGESKANAKWKVVAEEGTQAISFSEYVFSYRKKVEAGEEEFDWFHDTVTQLATAIYQLEPATTYEAYVRGRLGSSETDPTDIREITTDSARTYACGVRDLPGRMTVFDPLTYADAGTRVKIGQFELEMVDVQPTGEPGHFAGTGLVAIDFLMGAEAKVRYNDLKIDKEYVVWDGTADVITQGLDAWLEEQYQQFQDPIWVNGTIDTAYVSDSLAHVVVNGVDTTFAFPCPTCPVIINDAAGNQVTIYPNGVVVWSTYLDVSDEQLDVPDTQIALFEQNNDPSTSSGGGFDPYEHTQWHENYEIIRTSNAINYFVPNKSVKEGQTDKINVSVPNSEYDPEDVKLNWEGRTTPLDPVNSAEEGNRLIFTFEIPVLEDDEVAIYAVSEGLKIGKMNAVVYEVIEKKVKIIPIASTSITETGLEDYLNTTYASAGFSFNVTIEPTFVPDSVNTSADILVEETGTVQKYSESMKQIRKDYFSEQEEESDTYYLFIVNTLSDSAGNPVKGYMPRGKALGFISAGATIDVFAHELGHGGSLAHTWLENGPPRATTSNLMDYTDNESGELNLVKWQWEELRDPSLIPGFWDETEDAEVAGGTVQYYDILVEYVNGNERIVRRKYVTNKPYVASGPANNKTITNVNYVTGVNKYWKKVNGEDVLMRYEHFGKVFYMGEIVDCDNDHIRYGDHYGSNTISKYPGDAGHTASGVYEVRKLYLSGRPDPYKYEVRNYKLLPVINHLDRFDGEMSIKVFLNDKETSDQFRSLYAKYKAKEVSYEEIVLFFNNHPKIIYDDLCFPTSARLAEAAHFKGGTNDPETGRVHPEGASSWEAQYMPAFHFVEPVAGNSGYEAGLLVYAIIKNGDVYTRESILIGAPSSVNATSSSIHRDRGAENCHHTQHLVVQHIEWLKHMLDNPSTYDIDDVSAYIAEKGYCMLYDLGLPYRIRLFKHLSERDDAWTANRVNVISATYFTATKKDDEIAMLKFLAEKDYEQLRYIINNLEEYFDLNEGKDLNTAFGLLKHISTDLAKYPEWFNYLYSNSVYDNEISIDGEDRENKLYYTDLPVFIGTKNYGSAIDFGKMESFVSQGDQAYISASFIGSNTPMELMPDGRIKVTQAYVIREKYVHNGKPVTYDVITVSQPYYINPYDQITVVISSNYGALGLDQGQILTVPAITGMVWQQMLENAKWAEDNRILMRISEIAIAVGAAIAAPVTGGGSVALAVEAIAVINACVDIGFALWESDMTTQEYSDNSAYLSMQQHWANGADIFTLITGVALIQGTDDFAKAANKFNQAPNFSVKIGNKVWTKGKSLMRCVLRARFWKFGKKAAGETTMFSKSAISKLDGFTDDIATLASQQGMTVSEFKSLQQKRYDLMSFAEQADINAIRNSIPMPDGNTILQKVIPKSDIAKYLSGEYKQIGGFVSTAKDAKHLNTYEEIYSGARLDYTIGNGVQPYNLSDGSCGVIRYRTANPNLEVPKLKGTPDDAPLPFTGNGFTGGKDGLLGIPEWKSPYNTPMDGAELWEVYSNGTEVLRAKFSSAQNKFIPIQ